MLRFAIPKAPRAVKLGQVPGALRRLALAALAGVGVLGALCGLGLWLGKALSSQARFLDAAVPVTGRLLELRLPPKGERVGALARLTVAYAVGDQKESGVVELDAERAEGLGKGAEVALLVDPAAPSQPRALERVQQLDESRRYVPWAAALGALAVVLSVLRELKRAVAKELEPLRLGALVWLTPDEPLGDGRKAQVIRGHYFRDDVKLEVRARVGPGTGVVRQGDKVLAAVVPRERDWVRVVDESLARALGWLA